jgi:hypothetical protein
LTVGKIINDFSPIHNIESTLSPVGLSNVTLTYSTMITPFTQVPIGQGFLTLPAIVSNVQMTEWEYPSSSVTVTWAASESAMSYTVNFYYASTNTTVTGTLLQTLTVTDLTATSSTAIANGLFLYASVSANNAVGSSAAVKSSTTYVDQPPTNVEMTPWGQGKPSIRVTWTAAPINVSNTVTFYTNTINSTVDGTPLQTISGVVGTSASTTLPLVYGTYYYATVYAVTNVGISSTMKSSSTTYYNPFPVAPANANMGLVTANTTQISAIFTPSANDFAFSYTLNFYSNVTNSTSGGTLVETFTNVSANTFVSTTETLPIAGYYYATAVAVNPTGNSFARATTSTVYFTPKAGPTTNQAMTPYVPGGTTITATWTAAPFASSYNVTFYSNTTNTNTGGTVFQTFPTVSGAATSQNTSNTITQRNYYYATITATNENAGSATVTTAPQGAATEPLCLA